MNRYVARVERHRDPRLSSPALSRPAKGFLARPDAAIARRRAQCAGCRRPLRRANRQPRLLGLHDPRAPFVFRVRRASRTVARRTRRATRREILARQRGLTIFRGVGVRRDDLSPETLTSLAESLPSPKFRSRGHGATGSVGGRVSIGRSRGGRTIYVSRGFIRK